ncbi:unnamed protein product [Spirodela intermedia]|uniref:RING-type E3 ubiquitin transferase n=1 Tax=Spirodela intermedia TaxID=51605 RepID=A0A7I8ICN6_SPIIN|nr:unnamed protein product [Spirodela intermedia]CAA6655577.1 unnamed protein product [Spirodela intermedia]
MAGCSDATTGETVHVALGRSLKKGKMILDWVFKNLCGMEIVILHVHRPPKLIPMHEAEKYITKKRAEMNDRLRTFLDLCAREKMPAKELVIEAEDIYQGIVYLVGQRQIKRVVMGLRSIKEQPTLEKGLLSCQIWLVSHGRLVFTREGLLQTLSVEFSGAENQGSSASSSYSAGGSSEFHPDHAVPKAGEWGPSLSYSALCLQAKEDGGGPGKQQFEDEEDIRDLLVQLSEATDLIRQWKAEAAEREVSEDEFIEFSLPELEEAADRWLAQNGDQGR